MTLTRGATYRTNVLRRQHQPEAFASDLGDDQSCYLYRKLLVNLLWRRNEFDDDRTPALNDDVHMRDIHCISSLLKLYFRELPNPLLTYQLYDKFVVSFDCSFLAVTCTWSLIISIAWLALAARTGLGCTVRTRRWFRIDNQVRCLGTHPLYCPLSQWGLLDPIKLAYDSCSLKADS